MIDFHTHILPGIDDGSASAEESVKMLKLLQEQGVSRVLLTPHFYAHYNSVDEFAENREKAVDTLLKALSDEKLEMKLYLGCEVLYFDELWRIDNLKELCIQGTKCLLLEMPFSIWNEGVIQCVENLVSKGYTPIIAHFDRYLAYKGNLEKIYKMIEAGALLQMNCSYLNNFLKKRKAIKFIKKGIVFAIGSDAHNLTSRMPDFLPAAKFLKKKLSERQYLRFISRQKNLLNMAEELK